MTAVAGATWDISRGELHALRGRSGSGKTTLLNLIGGLDLPTEGRVMFDGADLGALGEDELAAVRRRSLGLRVSDVRPAAGAIGAGKRGVGPARGGRAVGDVERAHAERCCASWGWNRARITARSS